MAGTSALAIHHRSTRATKGMQLHMVLASPQIQLHTCMPSHLEPAQSRNLY